MSPKDNVVDMRSGIKHDQNKCRYDLIPAHPLNELAKLYTFGRLSMTTTIGEKD